MHHRGVTTSHQVNYHSQLPYCMVVVSSIRDNPFPPPPRVKLTLYLFVWKIQPTVHTKMMNSPRGGGGRQLGRRVRWDNFFSYKRGQLLQLTTPCKRFVNLSGGERVAAGTQDHSNRALERKTHKIMKHFTRFMAAAVILYFIVTTNVASVRMP